jgi:hypothetical protein
MRQYPSIALALARARLDLERNDPQAGVAVLGLLAASPGFRAEDWPLAREAATYLVRNGAASAAVAVYAALAQVPAPTPEAQRALLVDARTAAEMAGDAARTREFARMLGELSKPPQ